MNYLIAIPNGMNSAFKKRKKKGHCFNPPNPFFTLAIERLFRSSKL